MFFDHFHSNFNESAISFLLLILYATPQRIETNMHIDYLPSCGGWFGFLTTRQQNLYRFFRKQLLRGQLNEDSGAYNEPTQGLACPCPSKITSCLESNDSGWGA